MAQHQYYPEEVLIEKMQSGEYGWLDYVNHFSAEWQEEYARYCEERNLVIGNDSAAEFVRYKDEQLEAAMEEGNASVCRAFQAASPSLWGLYWFVLP